MFGTKNSLTKKKNWEKNFDGNDANLRRVYMLMTGKFEE